jgi:hypothetical protein
MKSVALAIALLLGGTALAQTSTTSGNMGNANSGDMAATQTQGDQSNNAASGPGTAGYSSESQTTTDQNGQMATDSTTQTGWNNNGQTAMATPAVASTGSVVQPSNVHPRRDERGIRVISMAAVVPAGWNGTASTNTGMGGPMLDPNTGQPVSDTGNYPACSRTVTDKCVQTYERGRR